MIGIFEIELDGIKYRYKNKIVNSGKYSLIRILGGDVIFIDSIAIGSSSTKTLDTHIALPGFLASKKISNKVIGPASVVFETYFGYNEGNGTIKEIGIMTNEDLLFARTLTAEITKTSSQPMKARYILSAESDF